MTGLECKEFVPGNNTAIIETYLDTGHDLLFIRFREPRGIEVGEPLPLKTPTTLFTEEGTGETTALEVIGISELLSELGINAG